MNAVLCPLCGQQPVSMNIPVEPAMLEDGTFPEPYVTVLNVCLCISGEGRSQEEADASWERSVKGFLNHVDEATPAKLVRPKSGLIGLDGKSLNSAN